MGLSRLPEPSYEGAPALILILFVLFLLANLSVTVHASQQAANWGRGRKLALGLVLFLLGQLSINILLVVLPNIITSFFPAMGFYSVIIGGVVAGLWLGFGVHRIYSWLFRRMGGAPDVH